MYKMQYTNYKNPNNISKTWSVSTITNILKDRIYIGDLIQHKYSSVNYKIKKIVKVSSDNLIIIENNHEAIIDKKEFLTVQEMLKERANECKRKTKANHILTGITFCKKCGARITYTKNHGTDFKIICSNYKKNGKKACDNIYISENKVLENIKNNILNEINKRKISKIKIDENNENIAERDRLTKQKNNNINAIKQIYNDTSKGIMESTISKTLIQQYVEENQKIENRINLLNKNLIEKEIDINKTIPKMNSAEFRSLIYTLISKIELTKEEIDIHYKFTPN